jgi:hypothetical protein
MNYGALLQRCHMAKKRSRKHRKTRTQQNAANPKKFVNPPKTFRLPSWNTMLSCLGCAVALTHPWIGLLVTVGGVVAECWDRNHQG